MLAVLSTAFLVIAAESLIRLMHGDKYGLRPVFYDRHETLGWAPAPSLDDTFYGRDFSMAIKTDEDGYRLGVRDWTEPAPRYVVLLGDSWTFGWGVSTENAFASKFVNGHSGGHLNPEAHRLAAERLFADLVEILGV